MKKIQILLTALAVVLAAGSAFSTVESRRATTYYQSTSPGEHCNTLFEGAVCPAGNGAQCEIPGVPTRYISKKVNGGDCEMLKRLN